MNTTQKNTDVEVAILLPLDNYKNCNNFL